MDVTWTCQCGYKTYTTSEKCDKCGAPRPPATPDLHEAAAAKWEAAAENWEGVRERAPKGYHAWAALAAASECRARAASERARGKA